MNIPIFHTFVAADAIARVSETLQTTFLSEGKLVERFEHALSATLGIQNPVALNSGTSALHLSLIVAGIGPGDEVILPAQTFIASGLAIMMVGATPVFADIEYETGNIAPASIKEKITNKTRAIMPVHWGGYPCEMGRISSIAKQHGLLLIEDAAHALGATYAGVPIGNISDFTCFSFQAIKHLTTGDGGLITTKTPQAAAEARRRRWFGIDRSSSQESLLGERQYDVSEIGYKYHMNDFAAALGLANLTGFLTRLDRLRTIASHYRRTLGSVPGITLFREEADRESAYWLFGLHADQRDSLIAALRSRGVMASVVHQRIDRNSIFGGIRPDLPNQQRFDASQVHIPCYAGLTDEMVEHVVDAIKRGW